METRVDIQVPSGPSPLLPSFPIVFLSQVGPLIGIFILSQESFAKMALLVINGIGISATI